MSISSFAALMWLTQHSLDCGKSSKLQREQPKLNLKVEGEMKLD